jgi:hypothetical protein
MWQECGVIFWGGKFGVIFWNFIFENFGARGGF